MIKRTLYFGNPAYLKTRNEQLVISQANKSEPKTIPIEDIGMVILDHQQITISQSTISKLMEKNTALITCNPAHHPTGLMLNLDGHSLQSQKFKHQINASQPLKKQLWQQTVSAKITNQAGLLKHSNKPYNYLVKLSGEVKSGDTGNLEAKAASYYWKNLFPSEYKFTRERFGMPPNNLLNYGYSILRAMVARSLVGSGLLPTLGIHHRNQYNAYCLADDIMEPYRPYVDLIVQNITMNFENWEELTPDIKKALLSIPTLDVKTGKQTHPMMVAIQKSTATLAKCFEGKQRKLVYPVFHLT